MKIIKKFSQYIKENFDGDELEQDFTSDKISPEMNDDETSMDMDMDMESDVEDVFSSDIDENPEGVQDDESTDQLDDFIGTDDGTEDLGSEEESHEYVGTRLMSELADRLGTTVENNSIEWNGKTISYFSETECFHIGGNKFKTIDEVFDYITGAGEEG